MSLSSTSSVFFITAAVAAGIATTAVYASSFVPTRKDTKSKEASSHPEQHFNVPPEILKDCPCKQEVVLAVRLALEAGSNMMEHYQSKGTANENMQDLDISCKSHQSDFATAIDVMNEQFIIDEIHKHFPLHEVIGEESTGTGTIPNLTSKPTWIIDPIDGTTNFASGLPLSCVSIGLCLRGQPALGVVYAPMTDELFIGVRGFGSYRNGVRLLDCTGEKAVKSLSDSVVCFEFGYARTNECIENMTNAVGRLLRHGVRTTRTLGSGVLDLCYVACGRMDVVYTGMAEEGWKPWDYCAGLVVAVEAGCTITHLKRRNENDVGKDGTLKSGYDFNLYSKSMICGVNEDVVKQCQSVVLGL